MNSALPTDHDVTTAELLVTDAVIKLPCGCTAERDCAHAAHMRQRPELAQKLIEHRQQFDVRYQATLRLQQVKEAQVRG